MGIKENYLQIRKEIPEYVKIVLAAKMRTKEEVEEVIDAGGEIIGENYVQEAERMYESLGEEAKKVKWHMIGSLQKNKISKALRVFDCIQTIDSPELAEAVNKRAQNLNRVISVFIEVNIGSEITKAGVEPNYEIVKKLAEYMSGLRYLRLEGLMTMGPRVGNPEDSRVYFRETKDIFEKLQKEISNGDLRYLSMGMSNSYKVAIEEGANVVRLGTVIFGKRGYDDGNINR